MSSERPAPKTETLDAFHRGAFHVLQPKGEGHRSGSDAMLLASLVAQEGPITVADIGAGAGAAGMAVASRLAGAQVTLVERSSLMADYARRSVALAENAHLADRVSVIEADVTLTGRARVAAGLADHSFDHVIMNPPFNNADDRTTPDRLKAEAHAMTDGLFEAWLRTAGAITVAGGQLSLIARPESVSDIIAACGKRFGGIEMTLIHPRPDADATRILLTAIKGSKARLIFRAPLFLHGEDGHAFLERADNLNNGRSAYARRTGRQARVG
ncbi:tRNA1(Val) A37 N6-methylase TrmN6 [Neorhizobium huautlense]|uniref:tRNA1(Val) A37 N6-methylase TrmN6 n=1 Tax=Neorhizobium huautlense TaxID=67774 RepID=A0ABT9PT52_9HYPH|nr:methyltransferase [Neorhizobium huautlense]MDP9837645.1 tRNA1(Val) A37 N6-methylase TrmN6 [Neorhizobium huautlense]